jgi:thiol-disulfide isomerase/thioredoxin
MNGPWTTYSKDPALYREKFQLVSKVMKEEAPNVAMVWTPFCEPRRLIEQYYPGDEWVDWVGVNIYSVYVHDGNPLRPASQEDPVEFLRYIYDTYAERKPIHISEFAATISCKGSAQDTVDFAIAKMTRFYTALRDHFPRVKSVNWFCLDTIRKKLANNNYSILQDHRVLATYSNLVKDDYFLSRVSFNPADFPSVIAAGTTLPTQGNRSNRMDDDLLSGAGAIAANLDQPYLRGLRDGDVVQGDLELRAQLPTDMKPLGLMWQIDGRTVALTNSVPYRVIIPRERIGFGRHSARVLVLVKGAAGTQQVSPDINFEIAP